MQQVPCKDFGEKSAVGWPVVLGHQRLEHVDFRIKDAQPEEFLEHALDRSEAESVGDVLEHGPTFQAVKMLVQPSVPLRHEYLAALETLMH
jgi:hypothetical protein